MEETLRAFRRLHLEFVNEGRKPSNLYQPARPEEVEEAEALLQFSLPTFLRTLYLEVENGGFGPGYGLAGVGSGAPLEDDMMVERYVLWRDPPEDFSYWKWPFGYLPVCHWGCAIYSVIDCTGPNAPVYRFAAEEYKPGKVLEDVLKFEQPSLEAWIDNWIASMKTRKS